MIIEKKEIINDLKTINYNLIKEVNKLKNKYYYEDKIKEKITFNNINLIHENNYYDYLANEYRTINNSNNESYKYKNYLEEKNEDYLNLSSKELILRKNKLIKIREEMNDEYSSLIYKKGDFKHRNQLEKKLDKINNSLLKIRRYLKNNKY